ncbi:acyl-CoA dehydrogenase family protein [Aromatoleum evansii]|uniref:acyl-CoA dehydrogenase family protein n=1 Tax=Aromatoleum evansii TaxID=59406 RepID=UPI00145C67D2|nr:acyl-CoA dehydrogenase family protein [Aromatoleum evansii]NMG31552.1 acyl-CoA dehydrogenase [Aromatoleum evansii]
MDFELSEDQRAIAEMAGSLFSDHCTDERLRAFDTAGTPFMQDLWGKCIETGLHALALPEAAGGSGLGMTELMLVLEAQGRALGQVPLWRHQLAAATLARFGGEACAEVVTAAAESRMLVTLALDDPQRGAALTAHAVDGGWRLDGRADAVALGADCCRGLILAQCPDGPRLVLVDLRAAGITKTAGVFTHGEAVADLRFDGVAIAASAVLPEAALEWLEPRAIAALAALQLGVSSEQIRRTVAYVSERQQFERAIATFQAVQMSMADAHIAVEALRSALWQLCYRLDAGRPARPEALATKYLACEAGHIVGHKAQHVHGGIGVDLTYPIHRYLYWSRALGITLGGATANLARLGDWLATNDTLGWKYDLEEHQTL